MEAHFKHADDGTVDYTVDYESFKEWANKQDELTTSETAETDTANGTKRSITISLNSTACETTIGALDAASGDKTPAQVTADRIMQAFSGCIVTPETLQFDYTDSTAVKTFSVVYKHQEITQMLLLLNQAQLETVKLSVPSTSITVTEEKMSKAFTHIQQDVAVTRKWLYQSRAIDAKVWADSAGVVHMDPADRKSVV